MKAEEQIEELKEKYQLGKVDLDTLIHRAVSIVFQQREEAERAERQIRDYIYDTMPTGETKAWDWVLWAKEVLKHIDNRIEDYKSKQ